MSAPLNTTSLHGLQAILTPTEQYIQANQMGSLKQLVDGGEFPNRSIIWKTAKVINQN